MDNSILIYGANGYTGKIISKLVKSKGLQAHLAGRNREAVSKLADELGFPYSIVSLDNKKDLHNLLTQFKTVIHCAGPFSETAKEMVEACIQTKTNYLDITGEIWVFETVMDYHNQAKEAGISLISGVGFDVVPTDCLAALLKDKMPDATHLEMAFTGEKTSMSRGTAVTMVKNVSKGGFIRKEGKITNVPLAYKVKKFDFPHGSKWAMTIPWGDLMTAYHQTKIPNIEIYSGAHPKTIQKIKRFRFLKALLGISWIQKIARNKVENNVKGPSDDQLKAGKTYLVGTIKNNEGSELTMKLITPEAYELTAHTAIKACEMLNHDNANIPAGYLTPAQAFGKNFIFEFEGVKLAEA